MKASAPLIPDPFPFTPDPFLSLTPSPLPFTLQQSVEPVREHLAPPRPVVVDVVAPDVERVRDALGAEDGRELSAAVGRLVGPLPRQDDDGVGRAQARQE